MNHNQSMMNNVETPGVRDCSVSSLSLAVGEPSIRPFFVLLQAGFWINAATGCSIKALLSEQLGLSPEYIRGRIQTIFLDGKPVDDLDATVVKNGSRLSLSAAMPGLVGATLRRGSILSSFRNTITHRETGKDTSSVQGILSVKLFNLIMDELGPLFLKREVCISSAVLSDFLENLSEEFWKGCSRIILNEKSCGPESLPGEIAAGGKWTYLSVSTDGG